MEQEIITKKKRGRPKGSKNKPKSAADSEVKVKRRRRKRKPSNKVGDNFDWRTLLKGDKIYLLQGYGPYVMYKNTFGQEVKEMMSERGWYEVDKVEKNGIHAFDAYGHHFIYFGPPSVSETGIIREPHKIGKVKRKEVDE